MLTSLVRLIEPLIHPIGWLWLAATFGFFYSLKRKQWLLAFLCGASSLIMHLVGNTSIPASLLADLERPYSRQNIAGLPPADAVVMLGGVLEASAHDPLAFSFNQASDRVMTALELMRLRKAPILILGGGVARFSTNQVYTEGVLLKRWIEGWKLPAGQIIPLEASRNTHDEALQVQGLMRSQKWRRVILVSSAFHLRRGEALFRSLEIPATPVASDFIGLPVMEAGREFRIFPTIDGFVQLTTYLHEQVGWYYYKARGWAKD